MYFFFLKTIFLIKEYHNLFEKRRSHSFKPEWTFFSISKVYSSALKMQNFNFCLYKCAYLPTSLWFVSCNIKYTCPQRPRTIKRTIQKGWFCLKAMRFKKGYTFLYNKLMKKNFEKWFSSKPLWSLVVDLLFTEIFRS